MIAFILDIDHTHRQEPIHTFRHDNNVPTPLRLLHDTALLYFRVPKEVDIFRTRKSTNIC